MSQRETRLGRKCGTCVWFAPRTEEQRQRFVPGDGFCNWKGPPWIDTWGRHNPPRNAEKDWCSCWLPDMAAV